MPLFMVNDNSIKTMNNLAAGIPILVRTTVL